MRIAVDHAEAAERMPPGCEHAVASRLRDLQRIVLVREQRAAFKPVHGEQPAGGQLRPDLRHADGGLACEHVAVERDVRGLANVIELLAQACGDLVGDLARVDRAVDTLAQRKQQPQLPQIGFDRRLHVGILQLAGQSAPLMRAALCTWPSEAAAAG